MLQNTVPTVVTNSILNWWVDHQASIINQRPQITRVHQSHLVWNLKCQGRQRSIGFVAATSIPSPLAQPKNESLFCSQIAHINQPRRHSRREIKTHVQENACQKSQHLQSRIIGETKATREKFRFVEDIWCAPTPNKIEKTISEISVRLQSLQHRCFELQHIPGAQRETWLQAAQRIWPIIQKVKP